ncbi:MAG: hypothetical protein NVS9B14_01110 [Candidatus Acidiferrum sp.]
MKKFFLVVAVIFFFASASSADPLTPALGCRHDSCFTPASWQTVVLGVPFRLDASTDGPLARATELLASVPPPALAPWSDFESVPRGKDSVVANPLDPEFRSMLPSHGVGAAEPPTLLLLATGLLCASLYRKHMIARRSRPLHFA